MKKLTLLIGIAVLFLAPMAHTAQSPAEAEIQVALDRFSEGCQAELNTYCKEVTPGEDRILACLYAFNDKLSSRCEYAVYDSIGMLNRTMSNVSYAIHECREDLAAHCENVKAGEGRLLDCLKSNESQVSSRCINALRDVGWME